MTIDQKWLTVARKYVGLREIPGKEHNPTILRWLKELHAWWYEDETPWCGTFVAAVMRETGYVLPKAWYRARAWLEWGTVLNAPVFGCVVVFARVGGGHVGFVVGRDKQGRLLVLGGNQSNRVSVAPFGTDRVLGYRWPLEALTAPKIPPPLLASNGAPSSANEA